MSLSSITINTEQTGNNKFVVEKVNIALHSKYICNTNMVELTHILSLIILIILSAISSGSETALVSLSEIKAKTLHDQKKRGSKSLLKLKKEPKKLIITILILNNLVNISAAAIATMISIQVFGSKGIGIATGIMTIIILIFGEITPKSYATMNNERFALIMARPIEIISIILTPITIPLMKLSDFLTRYDKKNNIPTVTEEEIKIILDVSEKEKIIEKHEKEYIRGVLKSGETTAREVMIPRKKMFVLESNMSIGDAIKAMIKSGYTRAPVIKDSRDNVTGIVHLKQRLVANQEGQGKKNISHVLRTPIFLSQKEIVGELILELQSKREHMAIVVDEFGGIEGLLTLEDLVEEILGEITDESENLFKSIKKINKDTILTHGETNIQEIEEFFKIEIKGFIEESNVNGILHSLLKDLPKEGDKIKTNGLSFVVEELSENVASKIRITKNKK